MVKSKLSKRDAATAQRLADNEPILSRKARVRLGELLTAFEPPRLVDESPLYRGRGRDSRIESFSEASPRILRRRFGQELETDASNLTEFCLNAKAFEVVGMLMSAASYVRELEGALISPGPARFRRSWTRSTRSWRRIVSPFISTTTSSVGDSESRPISSCCGAHYLRTRRTLPNADRVIRRLR